MDQGYTNTIAWANVGRRRPRFGRICLWAAIIAAIVAAGAKAGTPAELQDDGIPASTSAATPAAGSIWVGGSATNWLGLPIGANGYILSVDTGEATKLKWIANTGGGGSGTVTSVGTGSGLSGGTITTTGTIDLRLDATGTLSKTLGAGNNELGVATGGILNTHIGAGAAIGWTKISKTGSSLADFDTRSATDLTSGTLPDGRFPATLPVASGVNLTALNATNLASGTVPDARFPATLPAASGVNLTALNGSNIASGTVAIARGGTGAGTASAAFDALSPLTTQGDLLYYTTTNARLPKGTALQLLRMNAGATAPEWFTVTTPAPVDATYITQTANGTLTNEQALGSLATGILLNTTTTGVLSIAVAGDFPTLNQSTTGSAATLTTPRAIYGNNFDGSAALTQIIASTYGGTGNGFTKFTGPTTSEKTFTLPNSSETLLYAGGALGTPASGTLTNASGLPLTTGVTGILPSANGGTANGFTKFSGATTSEKTYTLPDASTTILTTNYTGALATGIVKNTTTTGALSIAVSGDFPTLNQSTTGSAATLTTARAIYGNNFDGSAALTQVIASTYGGTGNGFTKFTGPTTAERTFTLPDFTATLLYSGGALGTPASGGAVNLTGLPLTTGVTGVLPTANGGTNTSTDPAEGQILVATNSTTYAPRAISGTLTKTSAYNPVVAGDANKVIKCDASGGAFTVTLGAAATLGDGFVVTILKTSADTSTSTNAVTIDANASETIDGALTNRLQAQYSFVKLICDGSNWFVLSCSDWCSANGNGTSFASSGNYTDGTSLEVPPGEWHLTVSMEGYAAGVTTFTYYRTGISTTSGNSGTGLSSGVNLFQNIGPPATGSSSISVAHRVTHTAATTYYHKILGSFSGGSGTPSSYSTLIARRAR